jgi:hypothetical protein
MRHAAPSTTGPALDRLTELRQALRRALGRRDYQLGPDVVSRIGALLVTRARAAIAGSLWTRVVAR